ncbi:YfcC family protein [Peptoniphilus indolicus]|uniref:MFS family major facilitator transporter n=2 Tax=Peptoniphilus indolicus TaxID=33030 RepID=G4D1H3_9FIRM|nr:YfcC family protein [Peptoniphilus indolicus]EGY80622.1 MFS family major facilitator transporter [Peptoniphilus indolicus ATCC 29427]SUB74946.1 C4-dicarboxylate anaerobic carrier [Peptoniphilus indolicus]
MNKDRKKIKFDAFVIIFLVIVFCYFLTLVVPSGEFQREEVNGVTTVIANSFHATEKTYLGPQAIFQAVPEGLTSSASMMFVVMMVAGCIEIYKRSDAINKLVSALLSKADRFGSEKILSLIMVMFGCLGGFLGWNEQIVPFIPIIISLCLAMGYDVMTGIACSAMVDMISFSVSPSSVYTVGISHEVAQLPMFSGFAFRFILLVIFNIIMQIYVLRYARSVKRDPNNSYMKGIDDSSFRINFSDELSAKMNGRQKLSLLVFLGTFIASIVGVSSKGWSMNDLGAAFFFAGVMGGIINGMNINEVISGFIAGAKDGLGPALVIGLARGIQWMLNSGGVIDPIINALSKPLSKMGAVSTPIAVMFIISLFNGLITSGSAKATALMPILIPLADLIGMTRQTMILAFQFGDGLTNSLWFTSGTLLMFLTIAKIPLNRWYKFVWKLLAILFVVAIISLIIAVKINYGPF